MDQTLASAGPRAVSSPLASLFSDERPRPLPALPGRECAYDGTTASRRPDYAAVALGPLAAVAQGPWTQAHAVDRTPAREHHATQTRLRALPAHSPPASAATPLTPQPLLASGPTPFLGAPAPLDCCPWTPSDPWVRLGAGSSRAATVLAGPERNHDTWPTCCPAQVPTRRFSAAHVLPVGNVLRAHGIAPSIPYSPGPSVPGGPTGPRGGPYTAPLWASGPALGPALLALSIAIAALPRGTPPRVKAHALGMAAPPGACGLSIGRVMRLTPALPARAALLALGALALCLRATRLAISTLTRLVREGLPGVAQTAFLFALGGGHSASPLVALLAASAGLAACVPWRVGPGRAGPMGRALWMLRTCCSVAVWHETDCVTAGRDCVPMTPARSARTGKKRKGRRRGHSRRRTTRSNSRASRLAALTILVRDHRSCRQRLARLSQPQRRLDPGRGP